MDKVLKEEKGYTLKHLAEGSYVIEYAGKKIDSFWCKVRARNMFRQLVQEAKEG